MTHLHFKKAPNYAIDVKYNKFHENIRFLVNFVVKFEIASEVTKLKHINFMTKFDVASLFTNISINEGIKITSMYS